MGFNSGFKGLIWQLYNLPHLRKASYVDDYFHMSDLPLTVKLIGAEVATEVAAFLGKWKWITLSKNPAKSETMCHIS